MPPPWASYVPAVLCLGIFTSVRVAEQVRAGINSLPRGQAHGGTAMGLTETQTYRYVVLPRAFRIILPRAHLRVHERDQELVGGADHRAARAHRARAGRCRSSAFACSRRFTAATVIYLLTNLIVVLLMRALEKKVRVPGLIAVAGAPQAGH